MRRIDRGRRALAGALIALVAPASAHAAAKADLTVSARSLLTAVAYGRSVSQVEFDDIANTFNTPTRESVRGALQGYGNAFAARGQSLNETIDLHAKRLQIGVRSRRCSAAWSATSS